MVEFQIADLKFDQYQVKFQIACFLDQVNRRWPHLSLPLLAQLLRPLAQIMAPKRALSRGAKQQGVAKKLKDGIKKKPAAAGASGSPEVKPAMKAYLDLQAELGDAAGKNDKTRLLDAKIMAYKEAEGRNISFDTAEMRRLYNRWGETAMPSAPREVQELWSSTMVKVRGENKELCKRAIVFAWLRDEDFGDKFFQLTESVASTLQIKRKQKWLSKKQVFNETLPLPQPTHRSLPQSYHRALPQPAH